MTPRLRRILVPVVVLSSMIGAVSACTGGSTADVLQRWAMLLRPRLVLTFVDLSASMPRDRVERDLARLASELRPTDRLMVLGITGASESDLAPALDTTLPGSALARLESLLGLSTARTRREDAVSAQATRRLSEGAWTALSTQHGRTRQSAILEAVCVANRLAEANGRPTVAVFLTDGVEESSLANLARRVPPPAHARRLIETLRSRGTCPSAPAHLRVRIVGVRHATQTAALLVWWEATLRTLGVRVIPGDIAPYRVRPLLSPHRSPGTDADVVRQRARSPSSGLRT